MNEKLYQRYLETSVYTDVGYYKEFVISLPDDIPSIGMLVCDQITHPVMYFTEPSSYLEETYFGKISSYPRQRFGYSQFDLPRRKSVTASEAWLGLRHNTLDKKLDVFVPDLLTGVCEYLIMDFHALMNNEIFYSYQPLYLRGGLQALSESELCELDHLAKLLAEPDKNMEQIEQLRAENEKLSILTNHTQNIYHDIFGPFAGSRE